MSHIHGCEFEGQVNNLQMPNKCVSLNNLGIRFWIFNNFGCILTRENVPHTRLLVLSSMSRSQMKNDDSLSLLRVYFAISWQICWPDGDCMSSTRLISPQIKVKIRNKNCLLCVCLKHVAWFGWFWNYLEVWPPEGGNLSNTRFRVSRSRSLLNLSITMIYIDGFWNYLASKLIK